MLCMTFFFCAPLQSAGGFILEGDWTPTKTNLFYSPPIEVGVLSPFKIKFFRIDIPIFRVIFRCLSPVKCLSIIYIRNTNIFLIHIFSCFGSPFILNESILSPNIQIVPLFSSFALQPGLRMDILIRMPDRRYIPLCNPPEASSWKEIGLPPRLICITRHL